MEYRGKPKRVYVFGALNADAVGYLQNCSRMMETAEETRKAGFAVLNPCLDLLMGLKYGNYDYQDYFDNNIVWMKAAEALIATPGWENSSGSKKEIAIAESLGIPVFYSLACMVTYFENQDGRVEHDKYL